jgi:hypothetical protein
MALHFQEVNGIQVVLLVAEKGVVQGEHIYIERNVEHGVLILSKRVLCTCSIVVL